MTYYHCTIEESYNGQHDFYTDFIFCIDEKDISGNDALKAICDNFRDSSVYDEENETWTSGYITYHVYNFNQLSKEEFLTLSRYLTKVTVPVPVVK